MPPHQQPAVPLHAVRAADPVERPVQLQRDPLDRQLDQRGGHHLGRELQPFALRNTAAGHHRAPLRTPRMTASPARREIPTRAGLSPGRTTACSGRASTAGARREHRLAHPARGGRPGGDCGHGHRRRIPDRARHDGRGQGARRRAVAGPDPARRGELPDLRPRPGTGPDPRPRAGQGGRGAGQRTDRGARARSSPRRSPPPPTRWRPATTTSSSRSTCSRPGPAPART